MVTIKSDAIDGTSTGALSLPEAEAVAPTMAWPTTNWLVILLHYAADNTFLAQILWALSRGAEGNLCSNTMCQSSQSHLVIGQQSLTLGFDNSIFNAVIIVIANTLNGTIKIARSIILPHSNISKTWCMNCCTTNKATLISVKCSPRTESKGTTRQLLIIGHCSCCRLSSWHKNYDRDEQKMRVKIIPQNWWTDISVPVNQ